MNTKKMLLSVAVILLFGLYAFYEYVWNPTSQTIAPFLAENPTPTPPPQSGYKDGMYTGDVADAFYGQLQVKVTIKGGKITDVTYPVYPDSRGHTSEVSSFALPALKSEAIVSQNANVDIVSGATQTSEAFRESLSAALAAAKV